ncbi:MAG TPA: uracil-DNA glycosylase [Acidimicrobiia bacterium]|nr:uracil-DNA glycosylase [Acidimicrobiia bacterium]
MIELDELKIQAMGCTMCRLAETRTNVVFGVGSSTSELMFVGEAPGRDEDLRGEPFVGRAGQLLDQLLEDVGIPRQTVYIANVLKCRPPNNRNPQPDEIDLCKGYLRQQIRLIRPRVVVTLGNFATKLLLNTEVGISRLRGQAYAWWLGATLIPTFHPAFALRNGTRVTDSMRQDFVLMRQTLDEARAAEAASPEPALPVEPPTEATAPEPEQARLWS